MSHQRDAVFFKRTVHSILGDGLTFYQPRGFFESFVCLCNMNQNCFGCFVFDQEKRERRRKEKSTPLSVSHLLVEN